MLPYSQDTYAGGLNRPPTLTSWRGVFTVYMQCIGFVRVLASASATAYHLREASVEASPRDRQYCAC